MEKSRKSVALYLVGGIVMPPVVLAVEWYLLMGFIVGGVLDGIGGETERNYPMWTSITHDGMGVVNDLLLTLNAWGISGMWVIIVWICGGLVLGEVTRRLSWRK